MGDTSHARADLLHHPNPLVRWGLRAWLCVGILLVAWAAWRVAGVFRLVITPLVAALFPAGMVMPVVDAMQRRGWNRGLSSFLVTAVFLLAVVGLLVVLGWQVSQQLDGFAAQAADGWARLRESLGDPDWLPVQLTAQEVAESAAESSESADGSGGAGGGGLASVVVLGRSLVELGAQFFLAIVAIFFILRDRTRIGDFLVGVFPRRLQDDAREVGRRTWHTVTDYIRGQSIVAAADGILFAIGLLVLGVPLAWVLGTIVALGAFVPILGSIVAGAIGVGVALVTSGPTTALLALVLLVVVQQVEGNVLAPYVLGRGLDVHPFVVIVAVAVGATVLGPFGALIGVPLAASLSQAAGYAREGAA